MHGRFVDICHRGNVFRPFSNKQTIVKHSTVENEPNNYLLKTMEKGSKGNDKAKQ